MIEMLQQIDKVIQLDSDILVDKKKTDDVDDNQNITPFIRIICLNKNFKRSLDPMNQTILNKKMPTVKPILQINKLLEKNEKNLSTGLLKRSFMDDAEFCDEKDSNFDLVKRFKFESKNAIKEEKEEENEFFYDEMNEQNLWFLANEYDNLSDWKLVSFHLGLDENDIHIVQTKHLERDGLRECFYQCLLKWQLREPENCYFDYFIEVLRTQLNKSLKFIEGLKKKYFQNLTSDFNSKNNQMIQFYFQKVLQSRKNNLIQNETNFLKLKLEEKQLWSASKYLFQEWKTIGRELKLNELDLVQIESKHLHKDGIRECCYQTLLLWSQIFYENSTLEHLCSCLLNRRLNLYVKQLIELVCLVNK